MTDDEVAELRAVFARAVARYAALPQWMRDQYERQLELERRDPPPEWVPE